MINGVSPSSASNAIASKTSAELCTEFGAERVHHTKHKVKSGAVHSMVSVLGCSLPTASRSWRGNFARKKYECKRRHPGFAHIKAVIVLGNGDAAGVAPVEAAWRLVLWTAV